MEAGWWARLEGDLTVLEDLRLASTKDVRVIVWENGYFLTTPTLLCARSDEDAHAEACATLKVLLGTFHVLYGFVPRLRVASLVRMGPHDVTEAHAYLPSIGVVRPAQTRQVATERLSSLRLVIEASRKSKKVAQVLSILERENDYASFRKVLEIIVEDVRQRYPSVSCKDAVRQGLGVTWSEYERLRANLNSPVLSGERAVHSVAKGSAPRPSRAMNAEEVSSAVRGLVRRWVLGQP